VFLLGPSHHYYLSTCALSRCKTYETPLGALTLDLDTIAELDKTGQFDKMDKSADEEEHSLEMHLPYIFKMLSKYAITHCLHVVTDHR
jgi:AmmeMemoRadiSam system protein B